MTHEPSAHKRDPKSRTPAEGEELSVPASHSDHSRIRATVETCLAPRERDTLAGLLSGLDHRGDATG